MVRQIEVCPAVELPPSERQIVDVEGLPHSIGVFNIDGDYYAIANLCPHHLAPLCEGNLTGKMTAENVGEYELEREGEIIQCPWHGWKFNIKDGVSEFNPHNLRTRTYEAGIEQKSRVETEECSDYGTTLEGDEPPVDTYPVQIEEKTVVLYV